MKLLSAKVNEISMQCFDALPSDGIDTQKEKRNGESKKKRRKPSIRIKTDTVDL